MRYLVLSAILFAAPAAAQVSVTGATVQATNANSALVTATVVSPTNDAIVGGSSPVAKSVMPHTETRGAMTMATIPLNSGKQQRLTTEGYHIMLMGLKKPLRAGDTIPVTIRFRGQKPITSMVRVTGK